MEERVTYLDVACGLLIVYIIVIHCNQFVDMCIPMSWRQYVGFFMPWFFYKSGMFFQKKPHDKVRIIGGGKLMYPFVLYGVLGCFIEMICSVGIRGEGIRHFLNRVVYDTIYEQSIPGNRPLWFLLTLYLVIIIANYLLPKFHPLLVAGGSFICAYVAYKLHLNFFPWILGNLPAGICFYALGYWMRTQEQKWYVIILAILCYIGILFLPIQFPNFYFHANIVYGNYFLFFLVAISAIVIFNNLCRYLLLVYKFPILTHIGRKSMIYYVAHWILLVSISSFLKDIIGVNNPVVVFVVLLVGCVILLPIICFFEKYKFQNINCIK